MLRRLLHTTSIRRLKQVPDTIWLKPPPPGLTALTRASQERLSQLPPTTDKRVLESLESLDSCVRELYEESARSGNGIPVLRGTDEVRFGRKYIGMVCLPVYLTHAIEQILEPVSKKHLRYNYLRLADALRSTGQITPRGKGKGREAWRQRRKDLYGDNEIEEVDWSMPKPLPGEKVQVVTRGERPKVTSLVNPGTPLSPHTLEYGANETWAYLAGMVPATYGVIYNVMRELSRRVPEFRPSSVMDFGCGPATGLWAMQEIWPRFQQYRGIDISEHMLLSAETLVGAVPQDKCAQKIEFVRYLGSEPESDLVVSAFCLSELATDSLRKTTVEALWRHTRDTLVLVDRGTPDASRMMAEARQQLLETGECHCLAPLPNDCPDPTVYTPSWIHFSQRSQRPSFTMLTKHSKSNIEDLRYSYLIVRRGPRPTAPPMQKHTPASVSLSVAQEQPDRYLPTGELRKSQDQLSRESIGWPRIVLPPIKRKGHVVMDVCTSEGQIERWTFTKTHNKQSYRDARKSCWGDLFPHTPKTRETRPHYRDAKEKLSKAPEEEEVKRKTRRIDEFLIMK